jgi:hypothetical protein
LAYQGYSPPNLTLSIPIKKPKGGKLTADEKGINTVLAKKRIYVEHAIRGIKRQRIATDIFRNTSAGMIDLSIEVAAGLLNLTNQYRTKPIARVAYSLVNIPFFSAKCRKIVPSISTKWPLFPQKIPMRW